MRGGRQRAGSDNLSYHLDRVRREHLRVQGIGLCNRAGVNTVKDFSVVRSADGNALDEGGRVRLIEAVYRAHAIQCTLWMA